MAKQMNMIIRLKNTSEHTIAVANTVVSPKATVPIRVKKSAHIESILKAHLQGTISLVKADPETLAAMIGFDLGSGEEAKVESQEVVAPDDESTDKTDEKDVEPKGDAPDKADEKDVEPKGDAPDKEEAKKPAPKSSGKKKPAPKKEEDEQQNLLDEKE